MIKFIHIRAVDENGDLLTTGGCTVAYTATPKDIMYQLALCHSDLDNFCYRVGRAIASGRLKSKKWEPIIIPRQDPVVATIIKHIAANAEYGQIDIFWNEKGKRWESTFIPNLMDDEIPFEGGKPVAQMDCPLAPPL